MFKDWSPLELADALGYRIDLVRQHNGHNDPFLVGPNGRRRATSHELASALLARLARMKGVDPAKRLPRFRRALRNGEEQSPPFFFFVENATN